MKDFYETHKKEITRLVVFFAAVIASGLFVKYAFRLFAPFIAAFVLTLIISWPVDYITKKSHIPRFVSTLISMFAALIVLGGALGRIFRLLYEQFLSFSLSFPETLDKAYTLFTGFRESYNSLFAFFPDEARAFIDGTIVTLIPTVTSWMGESARTISFSAVKAIPKTLVFIIVTLVSAFFMTKDKPEISAFIKRQFPENVKNTAEILRRDIFGALWGYVRAQLILMCFSGTIALAGLLLLKYEYALLIGLLIACVDALPIFGPGFILWPWAAFSLLSGDYHRAAALIIIYLVIILVRNMLESKILSSQIGLHPLVTLVSMYVGLVVLGPIGLIAGPLLAIIARSLQNSGLLPEWK